MCLCKSKFEKPLKRNLQEKLKRDREREREREREKDGRERK